jgi:hypothetical protein
MGDNMIIVKHMDTNKRYILLGTGYGLAESARPSMIFGDFIPTEKSSCHQMLCVCDAMGAVAWLPSKDVKVVEVDGVKVEEHPSISTFDDSLQQDKLSEPVECANCGRMIYSSVCPYCSD